MSNCLLDRLYQISKAVIAKSPVFINYSFYIVWWTLTCNMNLNFRANTWWTYFIYEYEIFINVSNYANINDSISNPILGDIFEK